jgi:hypothetical protein
VGILFSTLVKPGMRDIVVSSQKDRANHKQESEWEGTFCLWERSNDGQFNADIPKIP